MNIGTLSRLLGIYDWEEGTDSVVLKREAFKLLVIKAIVEELSFDDDWYRATYPDVDEAVKSGSFESAHEHFLRNGYFENRLPTKATFDVRFYYKTYEDLQSAYRPNDKEGLLEHYLSAGSFEGRAPSEEWSRINVGERSRSSRK